MGVARVDVHGLGLAAPERYDDSVGLGGLDPLGRAGLLGCLLPALEGRFRALEWLETLGNAVSLLGEVEDVGLIDEEISRFLQSEGAAEFDQLAGRVRELWRCWRARLQLIRRGSTGDSRLKRLRLAPPLPQAIQVVSLTSLEGLVQLLAVVSLVCGPNDFDASVATGAIIGRLLEAAPERCRLSQLAHSICVFG